MVGKRAGGVATGRRVRGPGTQSRVPPGTVKGITGGETSDEENRQVAFPYMKRETLYINLPAIWIIGGTNGQDRRAMGMNRCTIQVWGGRFG